jgi:hypothetical protein
VEHFDDFVHVLIFDVRGSNQIGLRLVLMLAQVVDFWAKESYTSLTGGRVMSSLLLLLG